MIHVSDLDEAIKFYHENLGLPIALEARKFNHAELGPDEPLAKIGLHATGKKKRRKKRTGIVLDTDDIYALYERLSKEGVRFTLKPTKMPWGGIVADFLDPDGNELELVKLTYPGKNEVLASEEEQVQKQVELGLAKMFE